MKTFTLIPFFATLILVGCSSSVPDIQLAGKLSGPHKGGIANWVENVVNLNVAANVTGSCDIRGTVLEYSLDDGITWKNAAELPGADADCSDGNFSLPIQQTDLAFSANKAGQRVLLVRQLLVSGPTGTAIVTLRYKAPVGARAPGLRIVLGKVSGKSADNQAELSIRAYARGTAR